jgi:hypothetical protein
VKSRIIDPRLRQQCLDFCSSRWNDQYGQVCFLMGYARHVYDFNETVKLKYVEKNC